MTSPQFLLILRARWLLIAGAMFALAGAALAISIAMPKRYTAELQMLIDAKASDPILGSLLPPGKATRPSGSESAI
jgi:uncharacterized protein involved in exopolysaccharide biosynthesis